MGSWTQREAERANRNLLMVNTVIIVLLFAALATDLKYYRNFLLGSQEVSAGELAQIASPEDRSRTFVTVEGSKVMSTGFQDIVKHIDKYSGKVKSTDIKAEYMFLKVGDMILLVKAPPAEAHVRYTGQLVPTPEKAQANILGPLAAEQPELGKMVLPFTLDAVNYRDQGIGALAIGVPILLLCGWNLVKFVQRKGDLRVSPTWKRVGAFGNVMQLSAQIEQEMAAARKYGPLQVTPSWIIQRNSFSTWVSPVDDLAWVYKKVTKHSVNFIPTGKTYSIIIAGRHKQRVEAQMKEGVLNELLAALAARAPWAIYGFDARLEEAWRKDQPGFVSMVDARRQQAKAAPVTAAATS